MTINPYIVSLRADSGGVEAATFAEIDAKRMDYFAKVCDECDRPGSAELARSYAREYRMLADRLSGRVAVGSTEEAA